MMLLVWMIHFLVITCAGPKNAPTHARLSPWPQSRRTGTLTTSQHKLSNGLTRGSWCGASRVSNSWAKDSGRTLAAFGPVPVWTPQTVQDPSTVSIQLSSLQFNRGFDQVCRFPIAETAFNLLAQKITQQFSLVSQQVIMIEQVCGNGPIFYRVGFTTKRWRGPLFSRAKASTVRKGEITTGNRLCFLPNDVDRSNANRGKGPPRSFTKRNLRGVWRSNLWERIKGVTDLLEILSICRKRKQRWLELWKV